MRTTTRWWLGAATLLILATVAVVSIAAASFYRRARQVRTAVDMQVISRKVVAALKDGASSEAELVQVVRSVSGGKDAWGQESLVRLRAVQSADVPMQFVLVSRGSDGRLDVGNIDDYFTLQEIDVRRHYTRDIVFRNGAAVTIAGK